MSIIDQAIRILRSGGLVAFPTETVYGLGADATNAQAVRRIFEAKGRPSTNPLIAHVADVTVARRYALVWPDAAEQLARAFWPGPLTLVLPKHPAIVDEATAGLPTVGLRVPNHPLTLELLRAFDGPLAGPSANRSTRVSPTTAEHVRQELGDRVDLVLEGGPCAVGIESTVLDLSSAQPGILRPGGVPQAQIEAIIGPIRIVRNAVVGSNLPATSPGQQEVHYSPRAKTFRFIPEQQAAARVFLATQGSMYVAELTFGDALGAARHFRMSRSPATCGRELYAALRDADQPGVQTILIEMPPDEPAWAAIRDRVLRASRPLPIV
jgi:L-threonylcarbamoyladenylate synthase